MSDTSAKAVWGVFGDSTRGSSHLRSGLPNQDSIEKWPGTGGSPTILAVSDGHGSASHFRSELGSRMGVQVAVQALRETPIPVPDGHSQTLAKSIVRSWREAVMAHLAAHPFTEQEWAKLPPKEAAQSKAAILANPPVAYGATLLAVLAAASEILYLQLGDGDILCVDDEGGTTRPVPADSRLIANQTTSLCQASAPEDFRAAHFRLSEGPAPALILVSSDGYANSFQSDEDFLRLGPDYLELLRQYGPKKVEAQLQKILPEASRKGSGDDITLGFIQRMDSAKPVPGPSGQSTSASGAGAAPPGPAPARSVVKAAEQPPATGALQITPAEVKGAAQPAAAGALQNTPADVKGASQPTAAGALQNTPADVKGAAQPAAAGALQITSADVKGAAQPTAAGALQITPADMKGAAPPTRVQVTPADVKGAAQPTTAASPQLAPAAAKGAAEPKPGALKGAPRAGPQSAATVVTGARRFGPEPATMGKAARQAGPGNAADETRRPSRDQGAATAGSALHKETILLRRKVFWLKVALAGVCVLALTGAGLAWQHPQWVSGLMQRFRPKPVEPPDMPNPPRAPRSHPDEHRPSQDAPRSRGRVGFRYRLRNCTVSTAVSGGADPLVRGRRPRRPSCIGPDVHSTGEGGRAGQGVGLTTCALACPSASVTVQAGAQDRPARNGCLASGSVTVDLRLCSVGFPEYV